MGNTLEKQTLELNLKQAKNVNNVIDEIEKVKENQEYLLKTIYALSQNQKNIVDSLRKFDIKIDITFPDDFTETFDFEKINETMFLLQSNQELINNKLEYYNVDVDLLPISNIEVKEIYEKELEDLNTKTSYKTKLI